MGGALTSRLEWIYRNLLGGTTQSPPSPPMGGDGTKESCEWATEGVAEGVAGGGAGGVKEENPPPVLPEMPESFKELPLFPIPMRILPRDAFGVSSRERGGGRGGGGEWAWGSLVWGGAGLALSGLVVVAVVGVAKILPRRGRLHLRWNEGASSQVSL